MVVHLELEDVAEEELDVGGPGVHDDVEDLLLLNFPVGRIASCGIYIAPCVVVAFPGQNDHALVHLHEHIDSSQRVFY
jgi:hypothetical protein